MRGETIGCGESRVRGLPRVRTVWLLENGSNQEAENGIIQPISASIAILGFMQQKKNLWKSEKNVATHGRSVDCI